VLPVLMVGTAPLPCAAGLTRMSYSLIVCRVEVHVSEGFC
jgi:hypothetical protein